LSEAEIPTRLLKLKQETFRAWSVEIRVKCTIYQIK